MHSDLKIQEYLRGHSLADLEAEFGITARRHLEFPNLVMLKYNQSESPMGERIVRECRGIILDEGNGWAVVSRPYDKFFNWGEANAAAIDWTMARVYEKVDGSLCTLYFYHGWRVASSGLPDARGTVGEGENLPTFAELFWRTWERMGYALPAGGEEHCLMFELCSPQNRVVVSHAEDFLVLHGVREVRSGVEHFPEAAAERWGYRCVRTFPLTTLKECLAAAEILRPMESEGYVVCDAEFNRVKIKSPAYVALAMAKEGFNPRAILELVRKNEGDELLAYFPELRGDYERVKGQYVEKVGEIKAVYAGLEGIGPQKEFAAAALKTPYSAVLFAMRGKKMTAEGFMRDATIYAVERLLGMGGRNDE